jgi:hypothetical protein
MIPRPKHNTELEDLIIFVEKIFAIRIPGGDAKRLLDSADGMVVWREPSLLERLPQKHAVALLGRLAETPRRPGAG